MTATRDRAKRLTHRVEYVTRNEPYALGWGMKMGARLLLHAERIQALTARDLLDRSEGFRYLDLPS